MVAAADAAVNRWHHPLKRLLRFLLGLFLRVEVEGQSLVPAVGPVVVYFNHSNWIDPLVAAPSFDREVDHLRQVSCSACPFLGYC